MSKIIRAPALDLGRHRTCDVAFPYRMGAGFPGDVNRSHPFSVEPTLMSLVLPVLLYGLGVVIETATNKVRGVQPGDTDLYGIAVRPYPIQQGSGGMSAAFGTAVPPLTQPLDVLKLGYIMASIVGAPLKGGTVYVWSAASAGAHVQGGFEAANPGGSGFAVSARCTFNGPTDANGVGEIIFKD